MLTAKHSQNGDVTGLLQESDSNVVLKVYDVLGKEVATLVYGVQDAGYKEVAFDASRLTSGVYYYKLQANDFTSVKKMLLLQ